MGVDDEGTLSRLNAHRREFLEPKIADHRGRIVKRTGDGILIEFASAVDAARCAVEIQHGMVKRNAPVPQDKRIELRIGIHVGDIIIEEGDIYGDGVNIAARLEGIAQPGGICISDDAYRHVRGKLDVSFEDGGEQKLKNIARPVRVYWLRSNEKSVFSGRHDDAVRRLRRVIELDPNSNFAHGVLSAAYAFGGEADLAIQQAQTAIRLSPRDFLNVVWHTTGAWVHLCAERFEEAVDCARRAIDWNPAFADAHGVLAAASAYLGRMADARASLDAFTRLIPGNLADQLAARPFRRPADRERYVTGLQKAGLPELDLKPVTLNEGSH
jgi:hypothetical protein